jgi:hypothetical protein
MGAKVNPPNEPNEKFYGTKSPTDIIDGKVKVPEGSQVPPYFESCLNLKRSRRRDRYPPAVRVYRD